MQVTNIHEAKSHLSRLVELAFEGEEVGQNKDILYMTVTGANRTRVTTDKGLDFDPAWRPVGSQ